MPFKKENLTDQPAPNISSYNLIADDKRQMVRLFQKVMKIVRDNVDWKIHADYGTLLGIKLLLNSIFIFLIQKSLLFKD